MTLGRNAWLWGTLSTALIACAAPGSADDGDDDVVGGDDGTDGDDGLGLDEDDEHLKCPAENDAPDAPAILSPTSGTGDIVAAELTILVADYADPDGDAQQDSQWEIWQLAGGQPVLRVWSATLSGDALATELTLADGVFEVGTDLAFDKHYQVRVRDRAASGCNAWSAWSTADFDTEDGSRLLFDETVIRDVYLTITPEVMASLDSQAYPPGCVPYDRSSYPATLTFEGQTYAVGVKTKGGCGSARDPVAPFSKGKGKSSWKINLEWDDPAVAGCPASQKIYGQKSFTLNNEVQDKSFVHEQLAYHYYRLMGVAVPRANNVRLYVNGELWGLYLNLETVDRRMLGRNFASNDGMMYEGTYDADLISANLPADVDYGGPGSAYRIGKEFEASACSTPDEGADPTNYAPARSLVDAIAALPAGDMYPAVEAIFDFDAFLSMAAADAVINHWDGFGYNRNNFRVYHDPSTDRWSVIPSGVDQTFTGSNERAMFSPENQVLQRCFAEADCKAAFATRVEEALAVFEGAGLAERAVAIRDRISADVMADPRKEGTHQGFLDGVTNTVSFIAARPAAVREKLVAAGFPQE
jgi:spore coat protein CotH